MRIYLAILGREILDLHIGSDTAEQDPGYNYEVGSYPLGFAPSQPTQLEEPPGRYGPGWDE